MNNLGKARDGGVVVDLTVDEAHIINEALVLYFEGFGSRIPLETRRRVKNLLHVWQRDVMDQKPNKQSQAW